MAAAFELIQRGILYRHTASRNLTARICEEAFSAQRKFSKRRGRSGVFFRTAQNVLLSRANAARLRHLKSIWTGLDGTTARFRCFRFTSWERRGWAIRRKFPRQILTAKRGKCGIFLLWTGLHFRPRPE